MEYALSSGEIEGQEKLMTMLSNPQPHALRLTLSNGSVRVVGPWGLLMLPEYGERGVRLEVTAAEIVPTVLSANRPDVPPIVRRAA